MTALFQIIRTGLDSGLVYKGRKPDLSALLEIVKWFFKAKRLTREFESDMVYLLDPLFALIGYRTSFRCLI